MSRTQLVRRSLRAVAFLLATAAAFVGWRWTTGNVGVVQPGEVYRSAQLNDRALARLIEARGIRTVLNLRGQNPETGWYPAERAAASAAGATLIDVTLASDYWLTPSQATDLVRLLESVDRPLLIHCQFGAERTGLVSSMATLLEPGATLSEAEAQFSPYYLFLPTEDGLVMRGHLRQYERWLDDQAADHSPGLFRRWIVEGYRPGTPNRAQWPYDPYPLRVVTLPDEDAPHRR